MRRYAARHTRAVGEKIFETIWDAGGSDTIDWSNQSTAATIDLTAGEFSNIGPTRFNGQIITNRNLAIAWSKVVKDSGAKLD